MFLNGFLDQSYFIPPYLYGVIELYQATPHASNKFCTKAVQFNQDKIHAHYKTPSNHLSAKYLITYAKLYAEHPNITEE